jgi:DNA-binding NarL/FixJ family response regulator
MRGGDTPRRLRVIIVEDDGFTRVTLKAALERYGFDVVAACPDVKTALVRAVEQKAEVAVLDLDLGPGPTGLDLARGLRRLIPSLGLVMLTSYEDPRLLSSSLSSLPHGAAYVVKQSLEDLVFLVEAISGCVDVNVSEVVVPRVDLTDGQIETLRLLACGLTNAEIARVRVVEVKSVEQTITRMAKRLGFVNEDTRNQRVMLARAYYRLIGAHAPGPSSDGGELKSRS